DASDDRQPRHALRAERIDDDLRLPASRIGAGDGASVSAVPRPPPAVEASIGPDGHAGRRTDILRRDRGEGPRVSMVDLVPRRARVEAVDLAAGVGKGETEAVDHRHVVDLAAMVGDGARIDGLARRRIVVEEGLPEARTAPDPLQLVHPEEVRGAWGTFSRD